MAGLTILGLAAIARADGPLDNLPDAVRRIPKPGIEVPPEVRNDLEEGLAALSSRSTAWAGTPRDRSRRSCPTSRSFRKPSTTP